MLVKMKRIWWSLLVPSSVVAVMDPLSHDGRVHQVRQLSQLAQDEVRRLQLNNLPDGLVSLQPICTTIQSNFESGVICTCTGVSFSSFSISCEYQEKICSDSNTVCGRPFIALSLVDFSIFSTTSCIYEYTRRDLALADTCISIETCLGNNMGVAFCGCTAQYNSQLCQECSVCGNGHGLFLDCSNLNPEVVTSECTEVDVDFDLSGSNITGFMPSLNGLCSQLESSLNNRIECDCDDSGGGNFDITCRTPELTCAAGTCGKVQSKASFTDGIMTSIQSCSDFLSPQDLLETCVNFTLSGEVITSCKASYGGTACKECSVCDRNDGVRGITLDCSNIAEWAVVRECQSTGVVKEALEYVPAFQNVPLQTSAGVSITRSYAVPLLPTVLAAVGIAGIGL